AIDAHDPPRWMRDLVTRRDTHCVHPFCDTPATRCDLDHITAYIPMDEGGPPGQTHPANLAPLCRHHHRNKTHGHWTYHRTHHGDYLWHDQHGHTYAVTRQGTLELETR
ncbi:MAG: HNH endonuclease signature motif containing protein, partial [Nocardioides marinisabuli]